MSLPSLNFKTLKSEQQAAQKQQAVGDGERRQAFSFAKFIPPAPKPTATGNPMLLVQNVRKTLDYTRGMLIDGKKLTGESLVMGDQYFVPSGVCGPRSAPACRGKTRYMYIDNVPSAIVPCANKDMPTDPKCADNPTGLIAGLVQDVMHVNPFELMASVQGKGSAVNDVCELRPGVVGWRAGTKSSQMRIEMKCAPKEQPLVCSLASSGGTRCVTYSPATDEATKVFNDALTTKLNRLVAFTQDAAVDSRAVTPLEGAMPVPQQLESLPIDKYDVSWRRFCQTSLNTLFQVSSVATDVETTGHCLLDKVQCVDDWVLYVWLSLCKLDTQYVQIRFRMYYRPTDDEYWMVAAALQGNATKRLFDESTREPYTSDAVEGFVGGTGPGPEHVGWERVGWERVALLVLLVALCLGLGVRWIRRGGT